MTTYEDKRLGFIKIVQCLAGAATDCIESLVAEIIQLRAEVQTLNAVIDARDQLIKALYAELGELRNFDGIAAK